MPAAAVHVSVACRLPATAVGAVGASGTPSFTAGVGSERRPVPLAFFAATQNVYVVPLASPVTVSVVLFDLKVIAGRATAPTYGVTTYATIAEPLLAGAAHDTVARALPGTADRTAGAAGTPTLTGLVGAERWPVPLAFFAAIRNV